MKILAAMLVGLMLEGCALAMLNGAAGSGSASSSQTSNDAAISTSVRSKLAAKGLNLGVDTHDGVVTLSGQVTNVDQRNSAQALARSVAGVKSVQNRVTVR